MYRRSREARCRRPIFSSSLRSRSASSAVDPGQQDDWSVRMDLRSLPAPLGKRSWYPQPDSFSAGAWLPLGTSRLHLVGPFSPSTEHFSKLEESVSDSNALSRYEEATSFIASVENPKVRAALEYALATVLAR